MYAIPHRDSVFVLGVVLFDVELGRLRPRLGKDRSGENEYAQRQP